MPIIKSWRYLFTLSNVINNLYLLLYSIGSMLYNNHLAYSISNLYLISSELVFYMFNKLIFVLKFRVMDLVKLVMIVYRIRKEGTSFKII